jgi:GNAT superfamily N-acetyltransferase
VTGSVVDGPTWTCHAVDASRWSELVALFGDTGAREGCWCMRWRLRRDDFERGKGEAHRARLQQGIAAGEVHGIIGYLDGKPVGWCSFAPRDRLPGLSGSEALAPIDDQPVWSIACFFVARGARRQGHTVDLLRAAVTEAGRHGATLVEGYPLDPPLQKIPLAAAWTGLLTTFKAAGFEEVCRRAPARPIMRIEVDRQVSGRRGSD